MIEYINNINFKYVSLETLPNRSTLNFYHLIDSCLTQQIFYNFFSISYQIPDFSIYIFTPIKVHYL